MAKKEEAWDEDGLEEDLEEDEDFEEDEEPKKSSTLDEDDW